MDFAEKSCSTGSVWFDGTDRPNPYHFFGGRHMIVWFIRHLFYFRSLFDAKADAHQVALGCAVGMMLGILPKGNLVAIVLTMVVLALRMHLGSAMVSMLAFSVAGYSLDPITDRLGLMLLTNQHLAGLWSQFYQLPLAPWTSLNNTVVTGSLVFGLMAASPTYWLSKRCVRLLQDRWEANRRRRTGEDLAEHETESECSSEMTAQATVASRRRSPAAATERQRCIVVSE